MPDYDRNKTTFTPAPQFNGGRSNFVTRNFEQMRSHPDIKGNFNFAINFFFEAASSDDEKIEKYQVRPCEDSDSQVITEAITAGRRYMRTLVQTDKFADPHEQMNTGSLPIRLNILEDRLSQIRQLIDYIINARNSGDNLQLLMDFTAIYTTIQYGSIPSSALKRSLARFFDRVSELPVTLFKGYDDYLRDNGYSCRINYQLMKNPVYVAIDKCWYEESEIKKWLRDNENNSPHRNRVDPDDLQVDCDQQKKIKALENIPAAKKLGLSY